MSLRPSINHTKQDALLRRGDLSGSTAGVYANPSTLALMERFVMSAILGAKGIAGDWSNDADLCR
jgi:hypothetical protein